MTRKEYFSKINSIKNLAGEVKLIEKVYNCSLPIIIKQMISYSSNSVFFEDGYRTLSTDEIQNAQSDLHIDFISLSIIPVIDCGENDFIVYNFSQNTWSKFNITDECIFKKRTSLLELL